MSSLSTGFSPKPAQRDECATQSIRLHFVPPRPTVYTIELTSACNQNCVGCGNVFAREMGSLPLSTWVSILNRLNPDITSLRITGGECTLHPQFPALIQEIDRLGVPFVVFTNGLWPAPGETIQLFANCTNLDGLLISLHGQHARSHLAFVGIDSFSVVTQNIVRATQADVRVGTNTILLTSNANAISDIAALSFSLGATSAAFGRYYGKPIPGLTLTVEDLYHTISQLAELRQSDPRIILNNCVPACFVRDIDIPIKGCTSGFTHCTIDPLGNVRPCTHAPVLLGNILERDITTIWHSEPARQWRNLIPADCVPCGAFGECRGGCRATAYHNQLPQDPLIRSPFDSDLHDAPVSLDLYRHAQPIPKYTLREGTDVLYLIDRSRCLFVSRQALPILQALDGQSTLGDISTRFGQAAVDFVGTLILNGLVQL